MPRFSSTELRGDFRRVFSSLCLMVWAYGFFNLFSQHRVALILM